MKSLKIAIIVANVILWFFFRPFIFYCDYYFLEKNRVFRNPNAISQETVIIVMELFLLLWAVFFYKKYYFKHDDKFKTKAIKIGAFIILASVFFVLSSIITAFLSMLLHNSWM